MQKGEKTGKTDTWVVTIGVSYQGKGENIVFKSRDTIFGSCLPMNCLKTKLRQNTEYILRQIVLRRRNYLFRLQLRLRLSKGFGSDYSL
jgi:hypothetical protein